MVGSYLGAEWPVKGFPNRKPTDGEVSSNFPDSAEFWQQARWLVSQNVNLKAERGQDWTFLDSNTNAFVRTFVWSHLMFSSQFCDDGESRLAMLPGGWVGGWRGPLAQIQP